MKRIIALVATTLALGGGIGGVASIVASAPAGAFIATYHADLSATKEVPPNATGYTGTATINVNTATFEVCVNATTNIPGSDPIILQHIHQAPAGVNGPIVIPFSSLNSCATSTGELVANIVADPAGFYFNVHTQAFPAGAIRGQLVLGAPAPPPPTPTPADVIVVVQPRFTG